MYICIYIYGYINKKVVLYSIYQFSAAKNRVIFKQFFFTNKIK